MAIQREVWPQSLKDLHEMNGYESFLVLVEPEAGLPGLAPIRNQEQLTTRNGSLLASPGPAEITPFEDAVHMASNR
jgi:hypothetical protein